MKLTTIYIRFFQCLLIFTVISCDPVFTAKITNETSADLLLQLQFDKMGLEKHWEGRPYLPYLEGAIREGGTLVSFDTVNLVSIIILRPNESFMVEDGIGHFPDFELIHRIRIIKDDTIFLDTKEKMFQMFKEDKNGEFKFEIKKRCLKFE
jgi:hypothetical protein